MKKQITNRNITLGIYFLLFILVVGIWIWEIREFDEFLENFQITNEKFELENILYGLKISNIFTASIASLVLGLGLFLRNKAGWTLITGWFFFLIANGVRTIIENGIEDATDFFHALLFFLIPLGFIFLMNKFIGINEYHKTQNSEKLKLNLLAIGIGILLAVFRILKKNLLQQNL